MFFDNVSVMSSTVGMKYWASSFSAKAGVVAGVAICNLQLRDFPNDKSVKNKFV